MFSIIISKILLLSSLFWSVIREVANVKSPPLRQHILYLICMHYFKKLIVQLQSKLLSSLTNLNLPWQEKCIWKTVFALFVLSKCFDCIFILSYLSFHFCLKIIMFLYWWANIFLYLCIIMHTIRVVFQIYHLILQTPVKFVRRNPSSFLK